MIELILVGLILVGIGLMGGVTAAVAVALGLWLLDRAVALGALAASRSTGEPRTIEADERADDAFLTIDALNPSSLFAQGRGHAVTPYEYVKRGWPWALYHYIYHDRSPQARAASNAAVWDRHVAKAGHAYPPPAAPPEPPRPPEGRRYADVAREHGGHGDEDLPLYRAEKKPAAAPTLARRLLGLSNTPAGAGLTMLLSGVLLGAATAPRASAQAPSPSQASAALQQALQQQPGLGDVLRSRIRESGLSPDQIRARLRASGYPATLLDAYLGEGAPGQAVPGAQELAAIQALGLPPITGQIVTLDTGLVRTGGGPPSDVFGVDVFQRTTTQFLPLLAGPVPPDYKLGPGDNLVLILTGDVELAYSLQVTREGFVLIPQVGQVHVANLTLDQLRDVLYARLGRAYSGVRRGAGATSRFDVTVASVRANQVYVVGEVAQPGAYQVSSLGTVLTALYAAGGVTERANMRRIEVQRLGKTVAALDLYDYLLEGGTRSDIRLETGDVVFVGLRGTRVSVRGAVIRPATYELRAGQTLADLIGAAGGFRADAALERVSIERVVPPEHRRPGQPQRVVIDVPLAAPAGGDGGAGATGDRASAVAVPPLALEDGDVVTVETLSGAVRNYVELRGNVYQPGRYGLASGMTL